MFLRHQLRVETRSMIRLVFRHQLRTEVCSMVCFWLRHQALTLSEHSPWEGDD